MSGYRSIRLTHSASVSIHLEGFQTSAFSKNPRVTVHDPEVHADDRAGREECVVELQAGGGYDAFQVEAEGWVHAEAFFDDNGEALELLAFGPGGEGKGETV